MNNCRKSPGKMIGILSHATRRRIDQLAINEKFSGAEGKVLHYLLASSCDRCIYQKNIEEEFNLRSATVSELLKKMETDDLIIRQSVSEDGRLKKITLTENARQYGKKVFSQLSKLEEELQKNISQEDLNVFMKVAEQMIINISGDNKNCI